MADDLEKYARAIARKRGVPIKKAVELMREDAYSVVLDLGLDDDEEVEDWCDDEGDRLRDG